MWLWVENILHNRTVGLCRKSNFLNSLRFQSDPNSHTRPGIDSFRVLHGKNYSTSNKYSVGTSKTNKRIYYFREELLIKIYINKDKYNWTQM